MIRLAIVGSRYHNDYETFRQHILDWIDINGRPDVIISGGAEGLDSLARKFANEEKITLIEHLPDWKRYGKRAGPIRNQLIVNDATYMIAFPLDGPGTKDSINKMIEAKKPEPLIIEMKLKQKRKREQEELTEAKKQKKNEIL